MNNGGEDLSLKAPGLPVYGKPRRHHSPPITQFDKRLPFITKESFLQERIKELMMTHGSSTQKPVHIRKIDLSADERIETKHSFLGKSSQKPTKESSSDSQMDSSKDFLQKGKFWKNTTYPPKVSFGGIIIRFDPVTHRPQALLGYTYFLSEFLHGHYYRRNLSTVTRLLDRMTVEELLDVWSLDFKRMWDRIWMTSTDKQALYERRLAKFHAAFIRDDAGQLLRALVERTRPTGTLVWEPPAGKKLTPNEDDLTTAMREIEEEVGVDKRHYRLIPTAKRRVSFVDMGVRYVREYYIALALPSLAHQEFRESSTISRVLKCQGEISAVRWMDIDQIRQADAGFSSYGSSLSGEKSLQKEKSQQKGQAKKPGRLESLLAPAFELARRFVSGTWRGPAAPVIEFPNFLEGKHSKTPDSKLPNLTSIQQVAPKFSRDASDEIGSGVVECCDAIHNRLSPLDLKTRKGDALLKPSTDTASTQTIYSDIVDAQPLPERAIPPAQHRRITSIASIAVSSNSSSPSTSDSGDSLEYETDSIGFGSSESPAYHTRSLHPSDWKNSKALLNFEEPPDSPDVSSVPVSHATVKAVGPGIESALVSQVPHAHIWNRLQPFHPTADGWFPT